MRRILFIDHSARGGGATFSLAALIGALDRGRYQPVVACIEDAPELLDAYRAAGAEALHAPGISTFAHTTGGWDPLLTPAGVLRAARAAAGFAPSARATEALVRRVGADIVHLNSLVLAPCAAGAHAAGARVVWQVRESVHPGHAGVRRRLLARMLARWAHEAVFISADDRRRLTGGRLGVVIPNFVDERRFHAGVDGSAVRAELGIPPGAPLVLFLGGVSAIKGAHVLLPALALARRRVPGLHALLAWAERPWSRSPAARAARAVLPMLGSGTERQRFVRAYDEAGMGDWARLLPFRPDPERLMAAADLVVFPSTVPHFSRPVIEAGAMARPVVASRLGGVEELVDDGRTGLLVPPGDPAALADAIARVLLDPALARAMGQAGHDAFLRRFAREPVMRQLLDVYDRVLAIDSASTR
ncbi:MAG TPA: glycosyltransferase family 4 protein [Longimicrobium sp.]